MVPNHQPDLISPVLCSSATQGGHPPAFHEVLDGPAANHVVTGVTRGENFCSYPQLPALKKQDAAHEAECSHA